MVKENHMMTLNRLRFINGFEDVDSSESEFEDAHVYSEDESDESEDISGETSGDNLSESSVDLNDISSSSSSSSSSENNDEKESEQSLSADADVESEVASTSSEPINANEAKEESSVSSEPAPKRTKAFIRDKLIFKEINDDHLAQILPSTCRLIFENPDELHNFTVEIRPEEGFWAGGKFVFSINVTEEYNFEPPKVKCLTKIWHPNINEDGAICLSILRSAGIDENCWNPARQLKDVIFGINSLFTDLLNFHDPLNSRAAEMYQKDPEEFQDQVLSYIRLYAPK